MANKPTKASVITFRPGVRASGPAATLPLPEGATAPSWSNSLPPSI